ncbi:methyltransferase-like protein 24 [Penaeus monodon]|uniref:methyltransferase-like protein 24 n=1 Tax=Penaeus monodon TaxID=6687 RepID=UPI0018A70BCC|nr:methyltransferase-like protein 24 [Penaeus monodon]
MILKATDFTMGNKIRFILSAWACLVLFAVLGGRTDVLQPTSAAYSNLQHTPRTSRDAEGSSTSKGLLKDPVEYFESLKKTNGYCRKLVTFGGTSCKRLEDGDKLVCLDDHLAMPKKRCLVYSFGAGDDISFEDAMIQFSGCELHLFDPTVNASDLLGSDEKIKFHQVGLGDSEKIMVNNKSSTSYVFQPFDSILRQNGHVGRTIHYLKLDIESSEWARQHDILLSLEAIGFRKISYKENMNMYGFVKIPYEENQRPACGEVLYARDPSSIGRLSLP